MAYYVVNLSVFVVADGILGAIAGVVVVYCMKVAVYCLNVGMYFSVSLMSLEGSHAIGHSGVMV